MILALFALVTTACTPENTAAPATVTHTQTTQAEEPAEGAQPCTSLHVEAAVAPGEWPNPETWSSAVVVTNLGPDVCALEGASELRFFTGGNGRQLEVDQVTTDAPAEPVVLAVNDQASMTVVVPTAADPTPDCEEGGTFVDVVLPGDDDVVSTEGDIPAICGAVQVTAWAAGGAPGVEPN